MLPTLALDNLAGVAATTTLWAWHNLPSRYDHINDTGEFVGQLTTPAQLQAWLNAVRLGTVPPLELHDSASACSRYSDAMWEQLLVGHPAMEGDWDNFAHYIVRYASSEKPFERFNALRETRGLEPWSWMGAAEHANRLASMQYFFRHGQLPGLKWLTNWLKTLCTQPLSPKQTEQLTQWSDWMVENVFPTLQEYPSYSHIYPRVMVRGSYYTNYTLPYKWRLLRQHMPLLHIAAAWHNDQAWLSEYLVDDPDWCNYVYLLRLRHPKTFERWVERDNIQLPPLLAPQQALWDIAHTLNWSWPELLAQLTQPASTSAALALPSDFVGN